MNRQNLHMWLHMWHTRTCNASSSLSPTSGHIGQPRSDAEPRQADAHRMGTEAQQGTRLDSRLPDIAIGPAHRATDATGQGDTEARH